MKWKIDGILSWFTRDTKNDINPSINSAAAPSKFPQMKSVAASDLKFTKRNYNEAVLIREGTQEQYNNFYLLERI